MTSEDLKVEFEYAKLSDSVPAEARYTIIAELDKLYQQLGRVSTYVAVMMEALRDEDKEYGDTDEPAPEL